MDYKAYKKLSECALGGRKAELVLRNARIVNVFSEEITRGSIAVENGMIVGIGNYSGETEIDLGGRFVVPGFIDSHLHFESALAAPSDLVYAAMKQGTTTFVADPHEAANVAGEAGIDYILEQTEGLSANVFVMMPSCVPATAHEENGCVFTAERMEPYLKNPRILGLGEVMDYVSVIGGEAEMMKKLSLFSERIKDGHAPGLDEKQLSAYALAKIKTDHECVSYEYAMEEIRRGMYVLIREGSGAKNLEAIISGIVENRTNTDRFAFCTDDRHISDIAAEGHISLNVRKSIRLGLDPIKAIKMATINAAVCYRLDELGAVAPGYRADLVVLDSLEEVKIHSVYCGGKPVNEAEPRKLRPCAENLLHSVHIPDIKKEDIALFLDENSAAHVVGVVENQLLTSHLIETVPVSDGAFLPSEQYNKAVVIERHKNTGHIGVAPVKGFCIKNGAIGSTMSHDSHNMVIIGDSDEAILAAVRELKRVQGGYTLIRGSNEPETLPLPVMGLMTEANSGDAEKKLEKMLLEAHEMGVPENVNPFTTLSFLALPVIPSLRLTTKGLFDVENQSFVQLYK